MKIEKDAEWNRLEGRVGELRGTLAEAERKLKTHAKKTIATRLDIVLGETVVAVGRDKFLVTDVDPNYLFSPCVYGRKFRKDGKPADREQTIYGDWAIVPCAHI